MNTTTINEKQTQLINVLATLISYDSSQGIWVDPISFEYRFGQFIFENGGVLDSKICIGSLESLIDAQSSYAGSFADFLKNSNLSPQEIEDELDKTASVYWDAYQEQYLAFAKEWAAYYLDQFNWSENN
jgi:hypothetical protein